MHVSPNSFFKANSCRKCNSFQWFTNFPHYSMYINVAWYCAGITDSLIVNLNYKTLSSTLKGFKSVEKSFFDK